MASFCAAEWKSSSARHSGFSSMPAADRAYLSNPYAPVPAPGPATWSVETQAWIISRFHEVHTVLRSGTIVSVDAGLELARFVQRTGREFPHLAAVLLATQLFQSGARHAATRETVRVALADAMTRLTPKHLDEIARQLVDAVQTGAAIDAIPALADAMTNAVSAELLGLESSRLGWLRARGREVVSIWRLMPPVREYVRLEVLCREMHEALKIDLDGPVKSALVAASQGRLDYPVADQIIFLTTAAGDTTASTIAAALDLLATNPELQESLRQSPNLIGAFVEEVMRLAGPIRQLTPRIATAPVDVGGMSVAEGSALILNIERAHRDPDAFKEPGRIDLERKGPMPLVFGSGAHTCQGTVLGPAQVCALIACVLRRLHIATAAEPAALTGSPFLRQYAKLPLVFTPLAAA